MALQMGETWAHHGRQTFRPDRCNQPSTRVAFPHIIALIRHGQSMSELGVVPLITETNTVSLSLSIYTLVLIGLYALYAISCLLPWLYGCGLDLVHFFRTSADIYLSITYI